MGNYSRFASPVKDSDYNEAAKGVVPANTKCIMLVILGRSFLLLSINPSVGGGL